MYQIGEFIIYGGSGVCKVAKVGVPEASGVDQSRIYYTLCPAFSDSKTFIFAPVDTSVYMRPVITSSEVQRLIELIPSVQEYDNQDKKLLEKHYKELLQTHDCLDIIRVIKSICTKRAVMEGQGKKLSQVEERIMRQAEDLLYSEFSIVLGQSRETVKGYIESKITSKAD